MDENPYRAPVGVQKMRRRLPEFLRLPTSFIEWAVIVGNDDRERHGA
jgi:hypothetical protein